jgi:hypothetical protein
MVGSRPSWFTCSMQVQQRGFWFRTVQVSSVFVFVIWGAALLLISLLAQSMSSGSFSSAPHQDWLWARLGVGLVAFGMPLGVAIWRQNMAYLLLSVPVALVLFLGADAVMP